jgi:hypothetical protein
MAGDVAVVDQGQTASSCLPLSILPVYVDGVPVLRVRLVQAMMLR